MCDPLIQRSSEVQTPGSFRDEWRVAVQSLIGLPARLSRRLIASNHVALDALRAGTFSVSARSFCIRSIRIDSSFRELSIAKAYNSHCLRTQGFISCSVASNYPPQHPCTIQPTQRRPHKQPCRSIIQSGTISRSAPTSEFTLNDID